MVWWDQPCEELHDCLMSEEATLGPENSVWRSATFSGYRSCSGNPQSDFRTHPVAARISLPQLDYVASYILLELNSTWIFLVWDRAGQIEPEAKFLFCHPTAFWNMKFDLLKGSVYESPKPRVETQPHRYCSCVLICPDFEILISETSASIQGDVRSNSVCASHSIEKLHLNIQHFLL